MDRRRVISIALGLWLIFLGVVALAFIYVPGLERFVRPDLWWPVIVIGVAGFLLILAIVTEAHGLAVPASIVGGIGLLLFWQNATGNWDSWAWAWTLIPGFVGIGIILAGLLDRRVGPALIGGGWLLLISAVLFVVFAGGFGLLGGLGQWWPVLLILFGVFQLVSALVRRG